MEPEISKIEDEFDDSFYQKYNESSKICDQTGKVCFNTKTQAKNNRREYELKHRVNYGVYECQHCNKWHLTTVETKRDRGTNCNLQYGWYVFARALSSDRGDDVGRVFVCVGRSESKKEAFEARAARYKEQHDEPNSPITYQFFIRKTAPGRTVQDIIDVETNNDWRRHRK